MKKENEKTEKILEDALVTFFDLTLKKFKEYEEEDAKEKEEKEKESKKDEKEEKEKESKKDEKEEKGLNISDFVSIVLDELDEKYLRKKVKIELDDTNDNTESVGKKEKESKKEEVADIVDAEFKEIEIKEEPKKKESQKVEKLKEEKIETENKVKEPEKDIDIKPDENPVIDTSGLISKENLDNFNKLFISIRNTISNEMKGSNVFNNFKDLKLLGVKFQKGVFINGVLINTKNNYIFEVFSDGHGSTEFSEFKNVYDYKSRVYSRLGRASEMSKEEKENYLNKFPRADWKLLKKENK